MENSIEKKSAKTETTEKDLNSFGTASSKQVPLQKNRSVSEETDTFTEESEVRNQMPKKNSITEQSSSKNLPFAIPEAKDGAELIFVFDDAGNSVLQLEKYLELPFPVSIAVLPGLPASSECASKIRAAGKEILLHQPMQAVDSKINPGPNAIMPDMQTSEIQGLVLKNLKEVGPVAGMNNHEGSKICENEKQIGTVMKTASDQGIYFLDSRTTAQTRVPDAAVSLGLPYYQRDIFLDNPETKEHILEELKKGIMIANKKGSAIMIGHVWAADILPGILKELYPSLKDKGYRFCTVSQSRALITP